MYYGNFVIDNKSRYTDELYTYASKKPLKVGQVANLTFGKSKKLKRGFVFEDVKSLMVGSVIRDSHDLLDFLENVMKSEDPYIDERKKVNNKVNAIQKDFTKTLLNEIELRK